jgi:hypothetical protein
MNNKKQIKTEKKINNIACVQIESPIPSRYNFKITELQLPENDLLFCDCDLSPIMSLIGIPIKISCMDKKINKLQRKDNQFITYLMINPDSGFADDKWQGKVGKVILSREDKQPITKDFTHAMSAYFCELIEDFGNGKVPKDKMNKQYFDNILKEFS